MAHSDSARVGNGLASRLWTTADAQRDPPGTIERSVPATGVVRLYRAWGRHLPTVRGRGVLRQLAARLSRTGRRAVITSDEGLQFEFDAGFITSTILLTGAFEPEETSLLRLLAEPGAVWLDVGANVGYFSLLASRWLGAAGRVYAFEPAPDVVPVLRRNLVRNAAHNVVHVPLGAYAYTSRQQFVIAGDSGESHLGSVGHPGEAGGDMVEIDVVALDDFIAEERPARVDLIKIDTEGADFHVLKGAGQTLARFRPAVLLEGWLDKRDGHSLADVEAYMRGHGYFCQMHSHRTAYNVLCLPEGRSPWARSFADAPGAAG